MILPSTPMDRSVFPVPSSSSADLPLVAGAPKLWKERLVSQLERHDAA
jgi:hypothetical protein